MPSEVSSASLREALASSPSSASVTRDGLRRIGIRSQRSAIEAALAALDTAGCLAVIDAVSGVDLRTPRDGTLGPYPTRGQGQ